MDDYLNKPQWTVRKIPWITTIVPAALVYIAYWLVIMERSSPAVPSIALLLTFLIVPFIEVTTCTFDAYLKQATIIRQRIWRRKTDTFHFNDIHSVAVQESNTSDEGSPTYRIAFFMQNGEVIPLTKQYETGKRKKEKLAKKIAEYLQTQRGYGVNLALDGIVRIQQPVHPSSQNWIITSIFRNDSPPLTSFELALPSPISGFLLIVPAALKATTRIPGGLGGKIISKFYGAYFRSMDVSMQEITNLENSAVLQGPEMGLSKQFTVITDQPDWARSWLHGSRTQALTQWKENNPLKGKPATVEPHIFINFKGIKIVFRENYYQPEKINAIMQFINQLV
jgi:hypothetical protein